MSMFCVYVYNEKGFIITKRNKKRYFIVIIILNILILGVFCKTFLHKIAKTFCRSLQLHFVGNCKPGWQSWYLPAI